MAKVNILIVNFKNWRDTIECLSSLLDAGYQDTQLFVIDNSPNSESLENLTQWAEHRLGNSETVAGDLFVRVQEDVFLHGDFRQKLVLIKANENRGFSAANNVALRYMLGRKDYEFAWILNNDTFVPPESLEKLVDDFSRQPETVGILGTTLLYYHNPDLIQGLGGLFNKWFGTPGHLAEGVPVDRLQEYKGVEIDYPIGASMCARRTFLEDVGLMNEEYFLYFEELDWARRGQARGWQIKTSLECVVLHKEGASIGTGKPRKTSVLSDSYALQNRLVFSKKYNRAYLPTVYVGFGLAFLNRIRRGRFTTAVHILKIVFGLK
jgi:GT2 family glycosyltransferase